MCLLSIEILWQKEIISENKLISAEGKPKYYFNCANISENESSSLTFLIADRTGFLYHKDRTISSFGEKSTSQQTESHFSFIWILWQIR